MGRTIATLKKVISDNEMFIKLMKENEAAHEEAVEEVSSFFFPNPTNLSLSSTNHRFKLSRKK